MNHISIQSKEFKSLLMDYPDKPGYYYTLYIRRTLPHDQIKLKTYWNGIYWEKEPEFIDYDVTSSYYEE